MGVEIVAGDAGDVGDAGPVEEMAAEAGLERGGGGGRDAEGGDFECAGEG